MHFQLKKETLKLWKVLHLSLVKFFDINGLQWASAFAYNALLSLFPLILLFITLTSNFINQEIANQEVLTYIQKFMPITKDIQNYIFDIISGVIKERGQVSLMAFVILIWISLQCFMTLVYSINKAWDTKMTTWWSMSFKSIILLAIMLIIATFIMITFWVFSIKLWQYKIIVLVLQILLIFLTLCIFYKIAPRNRLIKFHHVYQSAIITTGLLLIAAKLFKVYITNFANINIIYGTFAAIVTILIWIYLSGAIIIFGACLSSVQNKSLISPSI